jgi:hypothetical protein
LPGLADHRLKGHPAALLLRLLVALCVMAGALAPGARAASTATTATTATSAAGAATTSTFTATTTSAGTTVTRTTTVTTPAVAPGTPVLISSPNAVPAGGYHLTGAKVLAIALRDPRVGAELRRHPKAQPYEYTKGYPEWQVSWFSDSRPQKELMQVYLDDPTTRVTQVWTGFQVAWTMARGYPGAFGRQVNSWYIWLPLCLLFAAPFVPWRRRPTLLHLDLVMLLGFSISLAFFNHAAIGLSVPLVYPFLIYLLVRMLALAAGRGVPREPLRTIVPASWLAVATVFLMAFRIGLNILNSNVIDVGYAGVIGADKLIHGHALYGHWPADNLYGDTYGPVTYYLYVPFRLIFGWSGRWDSLPAAHAAAIFFDLATLAGLIVLGRRLQGGRLASLLAYAWAAFPFTLYALNSNTNDSLVAALLVASLLVITSAPGRGATAALAGLTKFAPLALVPVLARGIGPRPRERSLAAFVAAFGIVAFVVMLPVVLQGNLHAFWQNSVEYQSNRVTPFSVWGLWGGLDAEQRFLQGMVAAGAVALAFMPARRGIVEVAALSAALVIALQMTATYWLYPYIVWFFPLVIVALFAAHPDRRERVERTWETVAVIGPTVTSADGEPIPIRITPSP